MANSNIMNAFEFGPVLQYTNIKTIEKAHTHTWTMWTLILANEKKTFQYVYIVIAMKCTLNENDKHLWEKLWIKKESLVFRDTISRREKGSMRSYTIPLDIGQIRYRFINTKLSWISHESLTDGTQELLNSKNKQ